MDDMIDNNQASVIKKKYLEYDHSRELMFSWIILSKIDFNVRWKQYNQFFVVEE